MFKVRMFLGVLFLLLVGSVMAQDEINPLLSDPQPGWYFSTGRSWVYQDGTNAESINLMDHRGAPGWIKQVDGDIYFIEWNMFESVLYRGGEAILTAEKIAMNETFIFAYENQAVTMWPIDSEEFTTNNFTLLVSTSEVRVMQAGEEFDFLYTDVDGNLIHNVEGQETMLNRDVDSFEYHANQVAVSSDEGLFIYDLDEYFYAQINSDDSVARLNWCGDILYFDSGRGGDRNIFWYRDMEETQLTFNSAPDFFPVCGADPEVPMFFSDRVNPGTSFLGRVYEFYQLPNLNSSAVRVNDEIVNINGDLKVIMYYNG